MLNTSLKQQVIAPLFKHLMCAKYYLLMLFISVSLPLSAQIEVATNHDDAQYNINETIVFELTSDESGSVAYEIRYDELSPALASGSIYLSSNQTQTVTFQLDEPGLVFCFAEQNGEEAMTGALVSANGIHPLEDEPNNLDAFWNGLRNQINNVPLDADLDFYEEDDGIETYRISLGNIDNRRVYGWITIPAGNGPFPAMITMPAYGSGAISKAQDIADKLETISISISVHNVPAGQTDPNAYDPNDIADPDEYYYRYGVLGGLQAIEYLFTRSDFDGENLAATGVSQGGGLALMLAGLDDRIDALAISAPALCQHTGMKYGKASGFPQYIHKSRTQFDDPAHEAATVAASKYYDASYFANRFDGPALVSVNYRDLITPAATNFAAINELRGQTIVVHNIENEHSHPSEFWNGRYDFFRRTIPEMIVPPFFVDEGFWANAGEDKTADTGESIALAGELYEEEALNYNWPVKWEQISGPGTAAIANPIQRNTNVSFDEEGVYILKLTAQNNDLLQNDAQFFTIADYIQITVGEGNGGGNDDDIAPVISIWFNGFDAAGLPTFAGVANETIFGLAMNDIDTNNGTVSNFSMTSGQNISFTITPSQEGFVNVHIPANSANDAAGNGNLTSNSVQIYYNLPADDCDNVNDGGEVSGNENNCESFNPGIIFSTALASGGTGSVQYQWEKANSLGGTWIAINGANETTYNPPTITETTYYRRAAKTNTCEEYGAVSNAVVKSISLNNSSNSPANNSNNYCDIEADNPWNQWITRVKMEDLDHSSNKATYNDFTDEILNLEAGNNGYVTLTPGSNWWDEETFHWRIWVDFNGDGDFTDANETLVAGAGPDVLVIDFSVPQNVQAGMTRMRVAMQKDTPPQPCSDIENGEVEDYTVILSEGGSTTTTYCTAQGTQPWQEWIGRVELANMDNFSLKDSYAYFADEIVVVEAGENYDFTVTPSYSHYDAPIFYWRAWIDYNQDGDFEDAGELIVQDAADQPITEEILVPLTAQNGMTIMRVAMRRYAYPDACGAFLFGEVEDYPVEINSCTDSNLRLGARFDVSANKDAEAVSVLWNTNTEYKNSHFIVEYSPNNQDFTAIDEVKSIGDGYLPNLYRSTHETPQQGWNYYRIKQVYYNGNSTTSEVAEVWFGRDLTGIMPYPNPTEDELIIPIQPYKGQAANLMIYNALGQTVWQKSYDEITENSIQLSTAPWQSGVYFLVIDVKEQRRIERHFVKL